MVLQTAPGGGTRPMNATRMATLELLRSEPKFVDAPGTICNGMRPEDIHQLAENQLNDLIDRLMRDPGGVPKKEISSQTVS
jgi:hypothetical protein